MKFSFFAGLASIALIASQSYAVSIESMEDSAIDAFDYAQVEELSLTGKTTSKDVKKADAKAKKALKKARKAAHKAAEKAAATRLGHKTDKVPHTNNLHWDDLFDFDGHKPEKPVKPSHEDMREVIERIREADQWIDKKSYLRLKKDLSNFLEKKTDLK